MDVKEHKKLLEEMSKWSAEILSSKESAIEFLVEAGINNPDGSLTEAYGGKPVSKSKNK